MLPSWLRVPSTFHILMGFSTGRYEIRSHLSSWELMKLLVALESANTSRLAVVCVDLNSTGIHMDQYLLLYMLIFNALAPAMGVRHRENPPSCWTWLLWFWTHLTPFLIWLITLMCQNPHDSSWLRLMTHYLQIVPYNIITDVTMTHADSCLLTYLCHHDSYWLGSRHMFVQHKHLVLVYKP